MSSKFRFTDNTPQVLARNEVFKDVVLAHAAQDIERIIKLGGRTPVLTGQMKASVRHEKYGMSKYRVVAPAEYSAVQELGRRRGARPFSNYTTPGTGAGWFKDAINTVARSFPQLVREAAVIAGVKQ